MIVFGCQSEDSAEDEKKNSIKKEEITKIGQLGSLTLTILIKIEPRHLSVKGP